VYFCLDFDDLKNYSTCTGFTGLFCSPHCNENPIYVFPEKGIDRHQSYCNFHIHVSVIDLYISSIGPHIFLQQNRQADGGNIKIAQIGTGAAQTAIPFLGLFISNFRIESLQCRPE